MQLHAYIHSLSNLPCSISNSYALKFYILFFIKGNFMKPETTASLVKELEKIKSNRSKNSYLGAWSGLFASIIWLARLYSFAFEKEHVQSFNWFYAFMFIIPLVMLLQSFFIIVRHLTDKKFLILFEAMLENKNNES